MQLQVPAGVEFLEVGIHHRALMEGPACIPILLTRPDYGIEYVPYART